MSHNPNANTNWQPYEGWLKRDADRAAQRKAEWLIRDLKSSVPNRLHGVYVTDEGEAI